METINKKNTVHVESESHNDGGLSQDVENMAPEAKTKKTGFLRRIGPAISVISLLVSCWSLWYSSEQTSVATNSLSLAADQLRLAKEAQVTAEKSYIVAKQQLEVQKKSIEDDNLYPIVYDENFLAALISPISHLQTIEVAFTNRTKRSQSYRVAIEAQGFCVYWNNLTPANNQSFIYLERNPVVLPPDGEYHNQFVVWHLAPLYKNARLRIYVNGVLEIERCYHYEKQQRSYIYDSVAGV